MGVQISEKPTSELCNLFMTLKNVPDISKIVKLKPLFQNGSKTYPSNYSPVSLLLLLSKIFEIIVQDQTNDFLSFSKILYGNKSLFQEETHSTDTCISF